MKVSLVIPAYHPNDELMNMTRRCIDSAGKLDETIVQIDPVGEGYIATTNKGLRKATGDILVVGNNDLTFHDGWLDSLLAPLSLGYDIATCWTSDQTEIELADNITEGAKFGSIFAMTREVYEKTGGFDPLFRDYFGDLDLQKRAESLGFKVGRTNNLVIDHLAKATYKIVDAADERYLYGMRVYESKYGVIE